MGFIIHLKILFINNNDWNTKFYRLDYRCGSLEGTEPSEIILTHVTNLLMKSVQYYILILYYLNVK